VLAPRPTPIPEDQASVFISPRGRMATHFSRPLRHAWVTVGLFFFRGHHTRNVDRLGEGKFSRRVWDYEYKRGVRSQKRTEEKLNDFEAGTGIE